jgi:hypothetical protein
LHRYSEGRRRLPRAFELRDELIIKGIAQHLTGGSNSGGNDGDETITVDPRDSLRLKFKLDMLGRAAHSKLTLYL